MMNCRLVLASVCVAALLGGCASMGDVLSGNKAPAPAPSEPSPSGASDVRGTVQSVDPQLHTITVSQEPGYQSNLRGSGDRIVLSYDGATTVSYQGQQYTPQDLENGDRVQARVQRDGERYWARSIDVIASVSGNAGSSTGAPRAFDGTVRNVDARNRTIEFSTTGSAPQIVLEYDSSTRVDHQGRSYRPEDLERGDQVHVTTRAWNGRPLADAIAVIRSVGGDTGSTNAGQVRGTIRYIDTTAHTIELSSASWAQGFNPDAGGNAVIVTYDAGTLVEYQGRRYGIGNLEPGDVVEMDVSDRNSRRPIARRIIVAKG
jgi:hypothetical protein